MVGRLTREPEVRYAQNDLCVARYTLAIDRVKKKGEETKADFIQCVAFGNNGKFAENYLHRGTKIIVEGRWQTGSYKNKDGNTVYTNECFIDRQEFAESKSTSNNSQPTGNALAMSEDDFVSVPDGLDSELPFS